MAYGVLVSTHLADSVYRTRLRAVQQAASTAGIDALLVTPGPDLRYLTGYEAVPLERLTCLVLPSAGDPVMVVPGLEVLAGEKATSTSLSRRMVVAGPTPSSASHRLELSEMLLLIQGRPSISWK